MNLSRIIKKYETSSTTAHQLLKALNFNAVSYPYSELSKFENIEDAFNGTNVMIVLYENSKNYGHFCCVLKRKKSYEFFDSYGIFPDFQLKYTSDYFRKNNNMLYPHLSYLLYSSDKKIEYNNYIFQSLNKNIKTCGRWCLVRALLLNYDIDTFFDFIVNMSSKLNISFDKFVVFLTLEI